MGKNMIDQEKTGQFNVEGVGINTKTPKPKAAIISKSPAMTKAKKKGGNRNSVNSRSYGLSGEEMPTLSIKDPFSSRVEQGYDQYCNNLHKNDFKNNSYGVSHIMHNFDHFSSHVELPSIKNRHSRFNN